MSFYKIGTCNYCDEENQILRPSPFMADAAMMCEHCWNETQKEYAASNGEYIPNFDSNKDEYENLKRSKAIKIEPVYTLMINDGEEYINCMSEVKIKMKNGNEYKGLFVSCDEDGMWTEVGKDESNIIFIGFEEMEIIEEI
ncbi:hypothetical protein NE172_10690 [Clostridium botulinum]|uniref:hypothetical protein n=1 Tax=Clostridium botulinum TaxID=1491 RepID=UPI0001AADAFB|nr:hypothetical protein [Clostridium botulinum]EES50271.1 hypothetical protein CLO_1815 [Clostridium botulinum E1 str. 'BoNT E Beluga']MCR1131428.1 hypothetical protein [Clostridium botulinum]